MPYNSIQQNFKICFILSIINNTSRMWRHIKMLYNRVPESFHKLQQTDLISNLSHALSSQVYYTPKLQRLPFTDELRRYLRFLRRRDKLLQTDLHSLVEAMLTEYGVVHRLDTHPKFVNNLNYSVTRNYEFRPNELSSYFGEADYMVWLNDTHFVPVLYFPRTLNPVAALACAHATMALKSIARHDTRNSGYAIATTGQEWQMFKVYSTLKAQKSVVYEGRNRFRNIIEDEDMIEGIFGMIDECLETEREEVQTLKLAYDVIDEGKLMLEAPTKEEAEKASPVSRMLKRYFQKKRDATSK